MSIDVHPRPVSSRLAVRLSLTLILAACSLSVLAGCGSMPPPQIGTCPDITIAGYAGKLYGAPDGNACAFKGIQYATANRWQAPVGQLMQPGGNVGSQFGPVCPQMLPVVNEVIGEEQCLYLNVWAPAGTQPGANLPVMVFIHGGAFVSGSGGSSLGDSFDGQYLAGVNNVVLVTFNYRLGALGTLYQNAQTSGNFGLQDQEAALAWVKSNIYYFGGDRNQVTLAGESAGAMSVGLHMMATPSGQNRKWPFRAAIMESNPLGITYKSTTEAQALVGYLTNVVPTHNLATATKEQIVTAQGVVSKDLLTGDNNETYSGFGDLLAWGPIQDSITVLSQPVQGTLPLPTVIGTNLNEGTLFGYGLATQTKLTDFTYTVLLAELLGDNAAPVLAMDRYKASGESQNAGQLSNVIGDYFFTCGNDYLAKRSVPAAVGPYGYQFTRVPSDNMWPFLPPCATQVCHGAELPFVFHDTADLSSQELALSASMAGYWTTFTKQLAPGSSPVTWPAYSSGNHLDLNLNIASASNSSVLTGANCSFWQTTVGYGQSSFSVTPMLRKMK